MRISVLLVSVNIASTKGFCLVYEKLNFQTRSFRLHIEPGNPFSFAVKAWTRCPIRHHQMPFITVPNLFDLGLSKDAIAFNLESSTAAHATGVAMCSDLSAPQKCKGIACFSYFPLNKKGRVGLFCQVKQ